MRNEPETEVRFQRGVSLKAKCRMLRMNDNSHEELGAADLAQMKEFVTTSRHVGWSMPERASVYVIKRVLKGLQYRRRSRGQRVS